MSRANIFIRGVLLFFCYSGSFQPVQAQDESCTNQLVDIEEYFSNGKYHMIPGYVDDCLTGGFSKAETITAYRLITITYLFLDELGKADSVYTLLLREDPERVPDPSVDPPDLVFLHNNFRTSPIFAAKIYGGVNYTMPTIIYNASLYSYNQVDEKYVASVGGSIGGGVEFNLIPQLSLGLEGVLALKYFDVRNTFIERNDSKAEIFHTWSSTESQFWLDLPIYLKYTIERGRKRPYFFGGFSGNILLYNQLSGIEKVYHEKESGKEEFIESTFDNPGFDIAGKRNLINYGLYFGAGIMFKLEGINYLTIDLRYNPGLTNIFNSKKRYDNEPQIIQYGRVGDDLRINVLSLNIGVFLPQYSPKKISDNTDM